MYIYIYIYLCPLEAPLKEPLKTPREKAEAPAPGLEDTERLAGHQGLLGGLGALGEACPT